MTPPKKLLPTGPGRSTLTVGTGPAPFHGSPRFEAALRQYFRFSSAMSAGRGVDNAFAAEGLRQATSLLTLAEGHIEAEPDPERRRDLATKYDALFRGLAHTGGLKDDLRHQLQRAPAQELLALRQAVDGFGPTAPRSPAGSSEIEALLRNHRVLQRAFELGAAYLLDLYAPARAAARPGWAGAELAADPDAIARADGSVAHLATAAQLELRADRHQWAAELDALAGATQDRPDLADALRARADRQLRAHTVVSGAAARGSVEAFACRTFAEWLSQRLHGLDS